MGVGSYWKKTHSSHITFDALDDLEELLSKLIDIDKVKKLEEEEFKARYLA